MLWGCFTEEMTVMFLKEKKIDMYILKQHLKSFWLLPVLQRMSSVITLPLSHWGEKKLFSISD